MLDHVGLEVADFARSRRFYTAVLAPLGFGEVMEVTKAMSGGSYEGCGFGPPARPHFWIGAGRGAATHGTHVAFQAQTHAQVDAFHAAALAAGARDNGAPGIRAHYHPDYYAAFVIDPDGHNVEAVCHSPAEVQP